MSHMQRSGTIEGEREEETETNARKKVGQSPGERKFSATFLGCRNANDEEETTFAWRKWTMIDKRCCGSTGAAASPP